MARSSSIPRNFIRRRREYDVDFTEATELLARLQALDALLRSCSVAQHRELDLDSFILSPSPLRASVSAPVDDDDDRIEELLSLLSKKRIRRPDSIPAVFVEAYTAVLAGRTYVNHTELKLDEWIKGRPCTCSEVIHALPEIDELLGTSLSEQFDVVHDTGTRQAQALTQCFFADFRP